MIVLARVHSIEPIDEVRALTTQRARMTARRQALDAAWRAAIVAAVEAGHDPHAVALLAGCSRQYVSKLVGEARRSN